MMSNQEQTFEGEEYINYVGTPFGSAKVTSILIKPIITAKVIISKLTVGWR